ncbi:hypothetical protein D0C36_22990 [Mucilaginibacter conchicola]|uniref:Methylamine utilisation protein MauE domain-containing protein n=1 Tax=Mucilaginibacter conchicola TaxID=2303333 RepID=A0A372NME2_9SPHI|nr:MauE/DoxX family redox-associated membrane protein [Mucilaginibacter conchicola]RFZ90111.1 hypothetical protein D0C36_22990 [Mucilaginibacter conchicola]
MEDKRTQARITDIICFLLILLYCYTAFSKLADWSKFEEQMYNQSIPKGLAALLIRTLPATEVVVSFLLCFPRTRKAGLLLSLGLLILFTGYIGLVVAGFYDRVPCSCGGVLRSLGWTAHLFFNLVFLLLNLIAIYFTSRGRREAAG